MYKQLYCGITEHCYIMRFFSSPTPLTFFTVCKNANWSIRLTLRMNFQNQTEGEEDEQNNFTTPKRTKRRSTHTNHRATGKPPQTTSGFKTNNTSANEDVTLTQKTLPVGG